MSLTELSLADLSLRQASQIHTVDVDGEAVILDQASGQLMLLNTAGALVWSLFDGVSTIAEICTDIAEVLAVPIEQVLDETSLLAHTLLDSGFAEAEGYTRPTPTPPPEVVVNEHHIDEQQAVEQQASEQHVHRHECFADPADYDPRLLFDEPNP
jgi:Coenzyme PQQ synthesis protein D (PqqD)